MAEITAEPVKALRERTDLPMMECKKALIEAQGDQDLAVKILKEKVKGFKEKSKDRDASEGKVATLTADDGSAAVMVELRCESAPVARSEDFTFLCDQLCKQLLTGPGASTPEELLAQPVPDRAGMTLSDLHEEVVNKIRENIVVARVLKVKGPAAGYTHHDGSVGVLMQVAGEKANADIIRDVAMHIAALNPAFCVPAQVDPARVADETAKHTAEAKASGKPDNIIEKMVSGKMRTFYRDEGVLIEQAFAKDDSKTVGQALSQAGLTAVSFTRWRRGQA